MCGKRFSEHGKSSSEGGMSTVALNEAKTWADALHDAEYRGRKDTDGAARFRLSKRIGVRESYLYRLQYRVGEMSDVAGEAYRRLKLAYDQMCERTEAAADRKDAERHELKATRDADYQKPTQVGTSDFDARN
ncbi:hypothetical protein [Hoeflea sp. 108]|uniref:hypothetical protein n=1 Tax=Hoeflea sp. 108 TaxID=1116369 RepID=UPI0012FC482F|nr:hypothetical protein [Hoeflea sp. 108]